MLSRYEQRKRCQLYTYMACVVAAVIFITYTLFHILGQAGMCRCTYAALSSLHALENA